MSLIKKYQEGGDLNDDLSVMMDSVISKKGGKREDFESLMDSIAFHESKYIVDGKDGKKVYKYFDHTAKQVGGGPGRGLFMFEEGDDAGGYTAVKRTINYYNSEGIEIPGWLKKASKSKSLDASTLTADQQKTLFLSVRLIE